MTQLVLEIDDSSLIPALKLLLSKMKGITIASETEKTYDPSFVAKTEESRAQIKAGQCVSIPTENLWKSFSPS